MHRCRHSPVPQDHRRAMAVMQHQQQQLKSELNLRQSSNQLLHFRPPVARFDASAYKNAHHLVPQITEQSNTQSQVGPLPSCGHKKSERLNIRDKAR